VTETPIRHVPTVPTPDPRTLAWAALLAASLADLGTTAVGLQLGASESNPLGRAALAAGLPGLVALKATIVGALGVTTVGLARQDRVVALFIPATVGLLWALAACWNAVLLLTAL